MTTHREAFIRTQSYYRITGMALHEITGVSRNHISEFINDKRDMRTDLLDRLVQAMEELEPGALQFYTDEIRGRDHQVIVSNPIALVDAMDNKQLSELMFAIAAKMGDKTSNQTVNKKLVISC
jgi:hypothetical protein